MGQTKSTNLNLDTILPKVAEYERCPEDAQFKHSKTHGRACVKIIQFTHSKTLVENYFKARHNLKHHPQVLELIQYNIVNKQLSQGTSVSSNNSLCTVNLTQRKTDVYQLYTLVEVLPMNLENEIMNRVDKKSFEEIQLWSVLSSAVLGALHLLEVGLKEPVLSPKGIGLSKEGLVKVGEWEIAAQVEPEGAKDEQEVIWHKKSKEQNGKSNNLNELLLNYYWAPEGIKSMQGLIRVGEKLSEGGPLRQEEEEKKFQVFSLGMTLISMCLRNFYYRCETFSEKYIDKLVHQSIEIRKVEGKPLSEQLIALIREMVRWDPCERITYFQLKDEIMRYFNNQDLHTQNSSFSIGTFANQTQEEFSISDNDKENSIKNVTDCFEGSSETFIHGLLNNMTPKERDNSYENSTYSFEGSGTVEQGEGDDYCPQEELVEEERNVSCSNATSRENLHSVTSRSKMSRRSYISSLKEPPSSRMNNQSYQGHEEKEKEKERERERERRTGSKCEPCLIDSEDQIERASFPRFSHLNNTEEEEENPDLFETLEVLTSRCSHNLQGSLAFNNQQFMTFNQSPTFQQNSYISKRVKEEQNIFTDPKLMEYIRSPVHSLNNTMELKQNEEHTMANRQKQKQKEITDFDKENRLTVNDLRTDNNKKENHKLVKEEVSKGYYEGEKKNGMRCGYGVFYYSEGGKYRGNWMGNKMHGKGVLEYADGRIAYKGDWNCDELHGRGILYNESAEEMDGSANYHDLNSWDECWLSYDGCFQHDDKCGKGVLTLSNGEYFSGSFRNDMAEGYGQFSREDGRVIRGIWRANQLIETFF